MSKILAVVLNGALVLLSIAPALAGTTYTVTNLNDSGDGSLRNTLAAVSDGDAITFAVEGIIVVQSTLPIAKSVDIVHLSGKLTLKQAHYNVNTLIDVTAPSVSMWNIGLRGIGGSGISRDTGVEVHSGGGIKFHNCKISDFGFGLLNYGTTSMFNCEVNGNKAPDSYDCRPPYGAGIYSTGTLTMTGCSVFDNVASTNLSCPAIEGAGLNNVGTASLTNCTFNYNNIRNEAGPLTMRSCTLSSAPASTGDGGIYLQNTLLAYSPLAITGNGGITSSGFNLSNSNNGFLTNPRDQTNVDPKLGPLQHNGGLTQTCLPGPGSAAIDRGFRGDLTADQRGQARPYDFPQYADGVGSDRSDVGSVEAAEFAQGPNYSVTISSDVDDGLCGFYHCSLREAIAAANADASKNTITFAPGITGTIALSSTFGQLVISNPVEIKGPGARVLALSGSGVTRVFNISGGPSFIGGVTIRDGVSFSTQFSAGKGAALVNSGEATFSDCSFIANLAKGQDGYSGALNGGFAFGGSAHNTAGGKLKFDRCTFLGNGAQGGPGATDTGSGSFGGAGGIAHGGAIYNDVNSTLILSNCTLANNSVIGGAGASNPNGHGGNGGVAKGAGIFNRGTMTLNSCTLRANNAAGGAAGQGSTAANNGTSGTGTGGVTSEAGATSTLSNSLIAENSGNGGVDANGTFTSSGYNLIGVGDYSTGFTAAGDQVGTFANPIDPKLGPLKSNGGPTDTMELLQGSLAIDQGKSVGLITDQRLAPRRIDAPAIVNATGGDGSDIGAVELAVAPLLRSDFNGDGFADFLLFNPSDQKTAVWFLQGKEFLAGRYGPTLPDDWAVACVADVNRDGGQDYILFNASTRRTAVWFLHYTNLVDSAFGPTLPANWELIATADFNRDAQLDFVLFNSTTRQTAIWFMSGAVFVSSVYGPTLAGGWRLLDALDFNANGEPDFVLFNPSTRRTAIWYLDYNAFVDSAYGPTLPSGWTLRGAADFNSDAKPDFVLSEPSTRKTAIWYLNGATFTTGAYGPTLAPGYTLAFP